MKDITDERGREYYLGVDCPAITGKGRRCAKSYRSGLTGAIYVYVTSEVGATFISLARKARKTPTVEAEGSGFLPPMVRLDVEPEDEIAISFGFMKDTDVGVVNLTITTAPESDQTRAAAAAVLGAAGQVASLGSTGKYDEAREVIARAGSALTAASGAQPSAGIASACMELLPAAMGLGALEPALVLAWAVLHHRERCLPEDHVDLQRARGNVAAALANRGDYEGARPIEERVLISFERTLGPDDPNLQTARMNLANTLSELEGNADARRVYEQVLEVQERTLPDDHPALQATRNNLANTLASEGEFSAARGMHEKVLDVRRRTLPPDHPHLQNSRLGLGGLLRRVGEYGLSLDLIEQAIKSYERVLPDDHPELLRARLSVADLYRDLGELERARSLSEAVLSQYVAVLDPDHASVQRARGELAATLVELGDPTGARALQEQCVKSLTRTLGGEDSRTLDAKTNLANTLDLLQEGQLSKEVLEGVVAARERKHAAGHPKVLRAKDCLALTLRSLGQLKEARELQKEAVDGLTRHFGTSHPDTLAARARFAQTLKEFGELVRARGIQEEVLRAYGTTYPETHPNVLNVSSDLAATLVALGELDSARDLEESVIRVRSETLSDDHPDLQLARGNHANTLATLGDLAAARTLEEGVLASLSRTLPDHHPRLRNARSNLALTLKATGGDPATVLDLQRRVLTSAEESLPDDHPEVQAARFNLAGTMFSLGDHETAALLEAQVLKVLSSTLAADDPRIPQAQANLAASLQEQGELKQAHELEESALSVLERTMPDSFPPLQQVRHNLAWTRAQLDDWEGARQLVLKVAKSEIDFVSSFIVASSPREAEERATACERSLSLVVSFALGAGLRGPDEELREAAFTFAETMRSAGLRTSRFASEASSFPELNELRRELRSAGKTLVWQSQGGLDSRAHVAAAGRRDRAWRQILSRVGEAAKMKSALVAIDSVAVAEKLTADDLAISYLSVALSRVGDEGRATEEALVAFIVDHGGELDLVRLGSRADIEDRVTRWRRSFLPVELGGLASTDAEICAAGEEVRERILQPLKDRIESKARLIVVPDGVLHAVPLDCLPSNGQLLGESHEIVTRSSLEEILIPPIHGADRSSLVAFGGVDYDGPPSTPEESKSRGRRDGLVAPPISRRTWEPQFPPLGDTGPEVQAIAELHERVCGDATILVTGTDASREALERLSSQARWLHVATHGWFAPDSIRSSSDLEPLDAFGSTVSWMSQEERVLELSPMVLCGLAFAGANRPADGGLQSGLFTAEELVGLDLVGCELAVLSACETSLGVNRSGQGVASLQRALHMAGARSVVTSLWPVPDRGTRELMTKFYELLWSGNEPKAVALWKAKMHVRNLSDDQGDSIYSMMDWTGWVLTGDPA